MYPINLGRHTRRLIMIPSKKSKKWIGVFIFYTIVVFISLLVTRLILVSEIVGNYIFAMLLISMGSALIPCIGGFLGRQMFFKVYTFSAGNRNSLHVLCSIRKYCTWMG